MTRGKPDGAESRNLCHCDNAPSSVIGSILLALRPSSSSIASVLLLWTTYTYRNSLVSSTRFTFLFLSMQVYGDLDTLHCKVSALSWLRLNYHNMFMSTASNIDCPLQHGIHGSHLFLARCKSLMKLFRAFWQRGML
jgi:hypothetical protein